MPKKKKDYSNDPRRKTAVDYRVLAEAKGFEWIEAPIVNAHTPTRWRCLNCGFEWDAKYSKIKIETGCPQCAVQRNADNRRMKPQDYHKLAAERNIRWIGEAPQSTEHNTIWLCENGHQWESTYRAVKQSPKNGCPYCAGNMRKATSDYHQLAKDRGLSWVGEFAPENSKQPTLWQCASGHSWLTSYTSLQSSKGRCPECRRVPIDAQKERKLEWARAARRANPEKYREQSRLKRKQNPEAYKVELHRRRAHKQQVLSDFTAAQWRTCLEYWNHRCAVCGKPPGLWHVLAQDHWKPLSKGGADTATNIVPLCHARADGENCCNTNKASKLPETWLVEQFGKHKAWKILKRIHDYFEWVENQP